MCFVSWQPAYHAPQISVYWCGRLFKGIRTAALLPLHRSSPSRLTARSYSLRWVWIVQLNTRLLWAIPLSVYLWRVVCSVLSCCTAAAGSLTDNPLLPTQINILPCPTAIHEVNKSDKKKHVYWQWPHSTCLRVSELREDVRVRFWWNEKKRWFWPYRQDHEISISTLKVQVSQNFLQDFLFRQLCWWRDFKGIVYDLALSLSSQQLDTVRSLRYIC